MKAKKRKKRKTVKVALSTAQPKVDGIVYKDGGRPDVDITGGGSPHKFQVSDTLISFSNAGCLATDGCPLAPDDEPFHEVPIQDCIDKYKKEVKAARAKKPVKRPRDWTSPSRPGCEIEMLDFAMAQAIRVTVTAEELNEMSSEQLVWLVGGGTPGKGLTREERSLSDIVEEATHGKEKRDARKRAEKAANAKVRKRAPKPRKEGARSKPGGNWRRFKFGKIVDALKES